MGSAVTRNINKMQNNLKMMGTKHELWKHL
jgi:hypothetical protein